MFPKALLSTPAKANIYVIVCEKVKERVVHHAQQKQLVVTIGGDHSIAMGTVSGIKHVYKDACLIWVDAHAVSSL